MLVLALAASAAPPIADPCCGRPPVTDRVAPDQPLPAARPFEFSLAHRLEPGQTLADVACPGYTSYVCGCSPGAPVAPIARSTPVDLGGGRLGWVEAVEVGQVPVCASQVWAFVVQDGSTHHYVPLDVFGRGTKGGATAQLKRVSPLAPDTWWIEIQSDSFEVDVRRVTLLGYIVTTEVTRAPSAPVLALPVWVDGTDLPGPRQIDVAWDGAGIRVTRRTEDVVPDQEIWLHRWSVR